jgi:transcriptional regulator with XRE-family HTH domain
MKEFNYKKLGKDLYNRRGKQMTLVETSKKIGVNTVTLSNIERGVGKGYTIRVILLITEFIGSKLDDYVE